MNFHCNHWLELISADMTKVLVSIMNSRESQSSSIQKLYGDPDQYAHKLGNDTFADQLPIHLNWIRFHAYKFLHYVSIDYYAQRVYYSNNLNGRLEYGLFIYKNSTHTYYLDFIPDSKQVTIEPLSKPLRIHVRRK